MTLQWIGFLLSVTVLVGCFILESLQVVFFSKNSEWFAATANVLTCGLLVAVQVVKMSWKS